MGRPHTSRLRAADLFGGLSSPLDPRRLNCSLVTDVWCGQISDVEAAGGRFKLLYMAFHQHSPAVLSGELINADGRDVVLEDPSGAGFPWRPPSLRDVLDALPPLEGKDPGGPGPTFGSLPGPVLLYFSAHWCPPCRKFTPQLVAFFSRRYPEVVVVPWTKEARSTRSPL